MKVYGCETKPGRPYAADSAGRLKHGKEYMTRQSSWVLFFFVLAALFAIAWPYRGLPAKWVAVKATERPLAAVKSWHYQLDHIDVAKLAQIDANLLVIDYAKKDGKVPLSRDEVAALKIAPDGNPRYVVAYLSVGESEEFRFYWNDDCKKIAA